MLKSIVSITTNITLLSFKKLPQPLPYLYPHNTRRNNPVSYSNQTRRQKEQNKTNKSITQRLQHANQNRLLLTQKMKQRIHEKQQNQKNITRINQPRVQTTQKSNMPGPTLNHIININITINSNQIINSPNRKRKRKIRKNGKYCFSHGTAPQLVLYKKFVSPFKSLDFSMDLITDLTWFDSGRAVPINTKCFSPGNIPYILSFEFMLLHACCPSLFGTIMSVFDPCNIISSMLVVLPCKIAALFKLTPDASPGFEGSLIHS